MSEEISFEAAYSKAIETGWDSVKDLARQIWDQAQAQATPEAEPVEVVGYLLTKGNQLSRMPAGGSDFPLMTVAQHQRIMASAPQLDADLVELLRACVNEFRGITMSRDLPQRIDAKLATLSAKNEGGKV